MYPVISWVLKGIQTGFDNASDSKQSFAKHMNDGSNQYNGMNTGKAPDLDTQNQGYFSKTMTDLAMPGMGSTIENNSPISQFMQTEKRFAAPVGTSTMGATAQGMTMEQLKQALFGQGGA